MARGKRAPAAQNSLAGDDSETQEVEILGSADSISVALLAAIQAEAPGPRRGALEAAHTALAEVKHRARGLDEHLRADFPGLLERIHAL